jgi:hypothetical protein
MQNVFPLSPQLDCHKGNSLFYVLVPLIYHENHAIFIQVLTMIAAIHHLTIRVMNFAVAFPQDLKRFGNINWHAYKGKYLDSQRCVCVCVHMCVFTSGTYLLFI